MQLKYDWSLDIATAPSRATKRWKNKSVEWSALLMRLANTTRTGETVAEYAAMPRDEQSRIKDQGGFVGGYCRNGSRTSVEYRTILCLDADFADKNLWWDWQATYPYAAAIYSTHKHTAEKPRLRLVVPLARSVTPEEYEAVGRKVAETLGIDKFDDTTYQPQRLMYWPSTSIDGEYIFDYQDAPALDPDAILATYHDWRDVSSWPQSSRVAEIVKRSVTKQQDPTTKPGLVGAFCRAYSIQDAIEAFVPTYQPCDVPGRYTYAEGSTAAGVVIYDGKFSYSHHATDPASLQLCNAWDLVRIHLYHELDQHCRADTQPSKRPSYKAMTELAMNDDRVRAQIVQDRTAEAEYDYATPAKEVADASWQAKLQLTEKGTIASTIANAVTILTHDPRLAGALAYNDMAQTMVAMKDLPWREVSGESLWTDTDDSALRLYMERVYGINSKDRIFDAVTTVAAEHRFHPVRDYLDGCTWDGAKRVDTLLIDYLGAEDTPYTRTVTRKSLVAAVARIYDPGCKFEYMLTLRGRQGIGKSALIAKLGGPWFSDSFYSIQGKDAYEQVQGVWIMEVGELAGLKKAEEEAIKLYISKQTDRFRPAYGRRIMEFKRQCIFIGTTNESQFLRDATGSRRFWVVDTPNKAMKSMWTELTDADVSQIWAEAKALYRAGETLYLDRDMEAAARAVQEAYSEDRPRAGIIQAYLDRDLPEDWETMDTYTRRQWLSTDAQGTVRRTTVSNMEIWSEALNGSPEKLDRYAIKEIRDIMSGIPGWVHSGTDRRTIYPYGRQKYYKRREL